MKSLRILVADDHDLLRRGLKAILQARPGWEICGEAHTGREAVAMAVLFTFDIQRFPRRRVSTSLRPVVTEFSEHFHLR